MQGDLIFEMNNDADNTMTNVSECLVKKEQISFRGRIKALSLPVLALFFILLPACMYGAVSLFYYCKT